VIDLPRILQTTTRETVQILDKEIPIEKYIPIDFSIHNEALNKVDLSDPYQTENFINEHLENHMGLVAYGGYNEERNLYRESDIFNAASGTEARSIHLGVDFWAKSGTKVCAPLDGTVHSFKVNNTKGDYGPTIILEHSINEAVFYTLYGHLSAASLTDLAIGKKISKGTHFARLGVPEENVNYAPHLHFQMIKDLQGNLGDYPGVCTKKERVTYLENCPDPNLLLKFK